jgi:hypothetical protein
MNPSNFDELTKALASSSSRRHALRLIVTTAVGGLFGLTSISTAFGRNPLRTKTNKPSPPPGNSNCAKWCAQVFGPNTPAAGQCTSDAAKGRGLCATCGTRNPSSICCVRNNRGFCNGTAGACCSGGQTPCFGCPSGQTCTSTGCCMPNCSATHNCGDDGCGGSCGTCTSPDTCVNGQCICVPDCTAKACGSDDGCGGMCQTGTCPTGATCQSGTCVCTLTVNGDPCNTGTDCCSGVCDTTASTCVTCITAGHGICSSGSDCCSNRCNSGICNCARTLIDPCATDDDCCSAVCCFNGNGERRCLRETGAGCVNGAECCSNNCDNGRCV